MTPAGAEPRGGHPPAMAQGAGLPLRPGALPERRLPSSGPDGQVTPKRPRAWAAAADPSTPEYQWTLRNVGPSWAPRLDGSCPATRPLGKPAGPQPQRRLVSPGPAPARGPRRPSTAQGAALAACCRPLPSLSSRCRKASSAGAPVQPFAPQAEGPGPRGRSAPGDDAGDNAGARGAEG